MITNTPIRGVIADGQPAAVIVFGEPGQPTSVANAVRRSQTGVIAVQVAQASGTPTLEVTLSSEADVAASSADWSAVTLTNGVAQIVHDVTAIRITRDGGNTNDCRYSVVVR